MALHRRRWFLACLAVASCSSDLLIPDGVKLSCSKDEHCPQRWGCGPDGICAPLSQLGAVSCEGADDATVCSLPTGDEDAICIDGECVSSVCGDGFVGPGETCDTRGISALCDEDCTAVICGDRTLNILAGEDCDTGGESASCDFDCTPAICGDGWSNSAAGEVCDDGNTITETECPYQTLTCARCDASCAEELSLAGHFCGDGVVDVEDGEACDDEFEDDCGFCNADCTAAGSGDMGFCGDGIVCVEAGEVCDDSDNERCLGSCRYDCRVVAGCGDRMICGDEVCDDGNVVSGDGCDDTCSTVETGWHCLSQLSPCVLVVDDCVGQPDRTLCEVDTTSTEGTDRSHDICVGGACVSPGCGTVSCDGPGPSPLWTDGLGPFTALEWVANEPVVADRQTGLVWQGCAAGLSGSSCATGSASTMDWWTALSYCNGLDWGGFADWYLPDIWELRSVIVLDEDPTIDNVAFPGTPPNACWSSSTSLNANAAWIVVFNSGTVSNFGVKDIISHHVRCVRLGP